MEESINYNKATPLSKKYYFSNKEKKILIKIIKKILAEDEDVKDKFPIEIENNEKIRNLLEEGILICKLISYWIPGSLNCSELNLFPCSIEDKYANQNLILNTGKSIKCKFLTNLTLQDFYSDNEQLFFKIIWELLKTKAKNQIKKIQFKNKKYEKFNAKEKINFLFTNLKDNNVKKPRNIKTFNSEVYIILLDILYPGENLLKLLSETNLLLRAKQLIQFTKNKNFLPLISADLIVQSNKKFNFLFSANLLTEFFFYSQKNIENSEFFNYGNQKIQDFPWDFNKIKNFILNLNENLKNSNIDEIFNLISEFYKKNNEKIDVNIDEICTQEESIENLVTEQEPLELSSHSGNLDNLLEQMENEERMKRVRTKSKKNKKKKHKKIPENEKINYEEEFHAISGILKQLIAEHSLVKEQFNNLKTYFIDKNEKYLEFISSKNCKNHSKILSGRDDVDFQYFLQFWQLIDERDNLLQRIEFFQSQLVVEKQNFLKLQEENVKHKEKIEDLDKEISACYAANLVQEKLILELNRKELTSQHKKQRSSTLLNKNLIPSLRPTSFYDSSSYPLSPRSAPTTPKTPKHHNQQ